MSYFNLQKIYIKNFRSIKEVTFELKPGLYSIEGVNLDQMSSGNGAGKTSICSGLFWALTGSSLNNEILADEVINLQTGKDCRVECYFKTDNGDLRILRTRKDTEYGNNLFLYVNDEDLSCHKIADTQERINQIFKVSWDLIKSTIIMTSDMKSCFSSLTPQNRISLLESVRDYSIWNKVREESNKDIKSFDSQIKKNDLDIGTLDGAINTYTSLIKNNQNSLEVLINSFNEDEIRQKITENNNQIKLEEEKLSRIPNDSNLEIDNLNNSLRDLKNQQQEIAENGNRLNKLSQNIDFDVKNIDYEINTIEKWFKDDSCPTCGRKLDRTEEEISNKTLKKNDLINQKSLKLREKEEITENVQKERQKYAEKELKIQEIQKSINDINLKSKERSDLVLQINNTINSIKLDNNNLENKLKDQDYKVNSLKETINSHQKEIVIKEKEKEEIQNNNKSLEEDREISKFFYDVMGPKGNFRPSLLRKDIDYLNQCIARYVKRFFDNTEIYLTKPDNENNKIDIIVKQGKLIKPVSSLSGGETKRLNLCIQLGLYDLIKSTCLLNFNFVCFDEIESQVDEHGIRALISIIEERKDYIPTILWITNNPNVSESIENKIICKKSFGFTEIEYK